MSEFDDGTYPRYFRRIAAYHEAGHAIIAYRLGLRFGQLELPEFTYATLAGFVHGGIVSGREACTLWPVT
jgi:hypothetical protein